jgi:hypothetical protein
MGTCVIPPTTTREGETKTKYIEGPNTQPTDTMDKTSPATSPHNLTFINFDIH